MGLLWEPIEDVVYVPSGGLVAITGGNVGKIWDLIVGGRFLHSMVTKLGVAKIGKESGEFRNQFRIMSVSLDGYLKVFERKSEGSKEGSITEWGKYVSFEGMDELEKRVLRPSYVRTGIKKETSKMCGECGCGGAQAAVEFLVESVLKGVFGSVVINTIDELECLGPRDEFDDDDYSSFMFVIYSEVFSFLLFAESEDTIFDPGISV
nr:protein slow walker 1 [Tanacetum cinerariifolium]